MKRKDGPLFPLSWDAPLGISGLCHLSYLQKAHERTCQQSFWYCQTAARFARYRARGSKTSQFLLPKLTTSAIRDVVKKIQLDIDAEIV